MATQFPTSLDSFSNPPAGSLLNSPTFNHATVHANIYDAIEAIEAKVGINGSSASDSLEYRLEQIETVSGTTIVRKTAADWTSQDPVLLATQIGLETDTLHFKFGTGDNWSELSYANITQGDIDNSLEDYILLSDRASANGVASLDSSGLIPDSQIPSSIARDSELSSHSSDTTGVHGISDTSLLLTTAGGTLTGALTLHAIPTSSLHAATKSYVDNIASGLNFHAAVHCATGSNLSATYSNGTSGFGATLTNNSTNEALTIDNHEVSSGERILVRSQTDAKQNGIYVVTTVGDSSTAWVLTRATDADNSPSGELSYGDFCFVEQGTFGGNGYILSTTGTITIGTTNISYTQFNAAQVITAGTGLEEDPSNTFNVDTSVIATKDFVNLISYGTAITGTSHTVASEDLYKITEFTNSSTVTITIPDDATDSTFPIGSTIEYRQMGDGRLSFSVTSPATLVSTDSYTKSRTKYSSVMLEKRASNAWILTGDIDA
jgi:hypothetical protein